MSIEKDEAGSEIVAMAPVDGSRDGQIGAGPRLCKRLDRDGSSAR